VRRTIVLLSLTCACTGEPTVARFGLPGATEEFYDLPYPNDLRRHPNSNTLDLSEFPTNSLIVNSFREAAEQLDGFSLNAAMFARFDGQLDPTSLPDPAGSILPTSSVYVVDVDPDSPNRGERMPIVVTFRPTGNETIGPDNLVVRPLAGFPLAEGTTYALVITTRVRGTNGEALEIAPGFAELASDAMTTEQPLVWAKSQYQPLFDYLDEAGDDSRSDVASASVFTTQNATFIAPAIRAALFNTQVPAAFDVMSPDPPKGGRFRTITGSYLAPNFQAGDPPYKTAPDGRIDVGSDGRAIITRMEPMRFMLTVPTTTMPVEGWPIVIYSHGTGGSWTSFISDGTADLLAREGIAVVSTDQVLHEPRNPGGDPELDFFNFGNVYAARDNALQGYADAWSQMRLITAASLDAGGTTHTFDADKVYFFGHSQGGITGPGFVAFEPTLKGAVLSGTAGVLYQNLLKKTKPLDIPGLVEQFARDNPMDEDNPSLAIVQMWVDRSDPINYAPLMVRDRPIVDGVQVPPRAIFQTEGFVDLYSPNVGIEAFAAALGADIVENQVQAGATKEILAVTLRGGTIKRGPITNNVNGTTVVLGQYNQRPGSDGHFVVFDIPSAQQHVAKFLGTLASTGQATVVQVQ
jgi:pimeloyl-ACP methyl ester carboxylesterase